METLADVNPSRLRNKEDAETTFSSERTDNEYHTRASIGPSDVHGTSVVVAVGILARLGKLNRAHTLLVLLRRQDGKG